MEHQIFDQGPGRVIFRGTFAECTAFYNALPADQRMWCKIY